MDWSWLTNYLDSALNWFVSVIGVVFSAIWDLACDLFVACADTLFMAIAVLIKSIPVPDFASGGAGSIGALLPDSILFLLSQTKFAESMTILGAGFAFRMLRKVFTLGQW